MTTVRRLYIVILALVAAILALCLLAFLIGAGVAIVEAIA